MKHSAGWRDNKGIILQVGLLVACGCLAVGIRRLVAAEMLSDPMALTLQAATVLVVLMAAIAAVVAGRRSDTLTQRVALRTVPIGFLLLVVTFAKESYADVSIALYALTTPSDAAGAVVALGPKGRDIRLSGSLDEGVSRRVEELLATHPEVERIHLTSDGGLVDEGEALRKLIAKYKISTFVPDYCVSACTLAFVGGRERFVMEGARLGFHAPYEEGLFEQTFAGDSSAERASYLASGVAPDFVDKAFKVRPSDIWTPLTDRLLSAHVATGVVDRYRFPDSNLDGIATKAGARATLLRNFPLARALDSWRPSAVDGVAKWYLDAFNRGLSEGETVDGLTAILGGVASLAMADADDETLIGLGRFLSEAMDMAESDSACADLGASASLIDAESMLNDDDDNADELAIKLLKQALTTRQLQHARINRRSAQVAMAIALSDARRSCPQMRRLYAGALRLPPHEAAGLIRTLVTHPPQDTSPALAMIGATLH